MKRFLSAVLALTLSLALYVPALAADDVAEDKEPPIEEEAVILRSADKPTGETNLPYKATVTDLSEGRETYTKYYFAPNGTEISISGELKAVGELDDQSRYAKIYLYKVNGSSSEDVYTVGQFVGKAGFSHTFEN